MGAVVLVVVAVVGLPLLLDTAPRPLPVDIPIDIPNKDEVRPLAAPASRAPARLASAPAAAQPEAALAQKPVESGASAAPSAKPVARADDTSLDKPSDKPSDKKPEGAAAKAALAPKPADAARAQAALEGKPAARSEPRAAEAAGRFVVQVGAYGAADSAREARGRADKLGLKTFTQVVETPAGKRIRVRVGPYSDRSDAERAAAQLKQAGLGSSVLAL